jgi:hypothetical protein
MLFLPPLVAGGLFCWWRKDRPWRITCGTLAGAAIFALDIALVLAYGLVPNLSEFWELPSGKMLELILEIVGCELAAGLAGALLGLIGASGAVWLRLLGSGPPPGGDARPSIAASQGME